MTKAGIERARIDISTLGETGGHAFLSSRPSHSSYRPEIDGLRALAVLPVILYHANEAWLRGGYVGVDVFFVISGYLITQIVAKDVQAGTFSIGQFYERRARRILPALFLVMLCCMPAAWALMGPAHIREFAKTIVAVSLFASNIFFARKTSYFAEGVDENPLRHTWSLGVEEQFYVVFPLLLMLAWRYGRRRRVVGLTIAIGVASFALSDWASTRHPVANFFLAPYRAWELMIGAVLALVSMRSPLAARVGRVTRELSAAIGIAMIVAAIALFDSFVPFPGRYALLPTLGTGLILAFADEHTLIGRLLSTRALVGIGLISYSAYLIHQPLIAFAKLLFVDALPVAVLLGLVVASFPLAYLSWKFVELPFRRRAFLSRRAIFRLAAVSSLFFTLIGVKRYWADRDSDRSYARRPNDGLSTRCAFVDRFEPSAPCVTSATPAVVVWGDSYAMHLVAGLRASDSALGFVQATKVACGPVIGMAPFARRGRTITRRWAADCNAFNQSVLAYAARTPSIDVVVLASRFDQYVNGEEYDLVSGNQRARASLETSTPFVVSTVQALRRLGKRVVLVAPPPVGKFNTGLCTERMLLGLPILGQARGCIISRQDYMGQRGPSLHLLEGVAAAADVPVLDFANELCDERSCRTILDGVSLFQDAGHFSYAGIALLGREMQLAQLVRSVAR